MSFQIPNPQDRRHLQTNRNNVSGTIQASKNINLDEEAYIKLAPKTITVMSVDDNAALDTADAINKGDGGVYINSDEVFEGQIGTGSLSDLSGDTNRPTPTVEDDNVYFNGAQVVSDGPSIKYLSGASTWTTIGGTSLSDSAPTVLEVFKGQNGLMAGRGNTVHLINTSWTVTQTLTLPEEYQVSSMASNGSLSFIGTRHRADGEAQMFLWDGTGSSASESYGIEAYEIPSIQPYGSSVIAGSSDGRVLRFNGGGFDEIAVFPIYMQPYNFGDSGNDYANVSNRGIAVDGNLAYINISSELDDPQRYLHNFSSGIWCLDPAVGLYHRYSPTYTRMLSWNVSTSGVNTSTDVITPDDAGFDTPVTGTPVLYKPSSTPFIGGLRQLTTYYVIYNDANSFKLAASYADAVAGTAIDLTGTGHATQDFLIFDTFDYGQQHYRNRAAVCSLSSRQYETGYAGNLVFTADVDVDGNTDKTVVSTFNKLLPNRGYFVTPRVYSDTETSTHNYLHIKHKALKTDDSITVKYRSREDENFPIGIEDLFESPTYFGTWTSTTTFTATHDSLSNVVAGNEIEIIGGNGAGFLAHVSSITESTGTYTVTLDEAFPWAQNALQFRFIVDDWVKLGTLTKDSLESGFRLDKVGEFIEFKVELRGVDVTIIEMQTLTKSHKRVV